MIEPPSIHRHRWAVEFVKTDQAGRRLPGTGLIWTGGADGAGDAVAFSLDALLEEDAKVKEGNNWRIARVTNVSLQDPTEPFVGDQIKTE